MTLLLSPEGLFETLGGGIALHGGLVDAVIQPLEDVGHRQGPEAGPDQRIEAEAESKNKKYQGWVKVKQSKVALRNSIFRHQKCLVGLHIHDISVGQ